MFRNLSHFELIIYFVLSYCREFSYFISIFYYFLYKNWLNWRNTFLIIISRNKKDFSSLFFVYRTDNVSLTLNGNKTLTVRTAMGLDDLEFTFESCEVDWIMIPRGPLHGQIGKNSLSVEFELDIGKPDFKSSFTSDIVLKKVNLEVYKDVQMSLKGSGFLHWIEEKILNFVANGNAAKNMWNDIIDNEFRKHLPKFEILIKPILQVQSPSHAEIRVWMSTSGQY